MTHKSLQQTIHDKIPLSKHMGFNIASLSTSQIEVTAPLSANINIHGTAFAGSIYAIATLTAWALAYHTLQSANSSADLVLGEGQITYKAPIKTDLLCATTIDQEQRERFLQTLVEKGRSRLSLTVNISDSAYWTGKLSAINPS